MWVCIKQLSDRLIWRDYTQWEKASEKMSALRSGGVMRLRHEGKSEWFHKQMPAIMVITWWWYNRMWMEWKRNALTSQWIDQYIWLGLWEKSFFFHYFVVVVVVGDYFINEMILLNADPRSNLLCAHSNLYVRTHKHWDWESERKRVRVAQRHHPHHQQPLFTGTENKLTRTRNDGQQVNK